MESPKAYLAQEAALAAGEASEVVADAGNLKSDSTAKRRSGLACILTGNDTPLKTNMPPENQWLEMVGRCIPYWNNPFSGPLAE